LGGYAGPLVVFGLVVALSAYMFLRSRLAPVTAHNVNDDWAGPPRATRPRTEVAA
jgi:PiT family inorganic phosphate transporter